MSGEEFRLSGDQGADGSTAAAYAEREQRISADVASLAAMAHPGLDQQISK